MSMPAGTERPPSACTRAGPRCRAIAARGAKADFVAVNMADPYRPPDDRPLRSMIYSANERVVRDADVDGRQLVKDGRGIAFDKRAAN